ncbi:MAG: helix-turn-helix domain-containing protein [Clostridia bacterium]|nr:helix-turn-helix domain-containing protein [Clostridia bacterium]MBQ9401524.1 helix-turn-helix domain-containing protein [Clostridia bacterium]
MTIGEKIRIRRKELGLTTTELGNMIGVQNSAISKYEKGRIELKASQIKAIAEVLQINPVLLLDDDGPDLTNEERILVSAYRAADPSARKFALQILENNRAM